MTVNALLVLAAVLLGGVALAAPLGAHFANLWSSEETGLTPPPGPFERGLYRVFHIDPSRPQSAARYAICLIGFNCVGFLILFILLRLQGVWPLGHDHSARIPPAAAFRIAMGSLAQNGVDDALIAYPIGAAASFCRLFVQIFVGGGASLAVASALTRAFAAPGRPGVGNFWSDLTRNSLYGLLPVSLLVIAVLAIARAAEAFGAPKLTGLIPVVAVNAVRFACAFAFGRMTRSRSDGRALVIAMMVMSALTTWISEVPRIDVIASGSAGGGSQRLFQILLREAIEAGIGPGFASGLVIALLAVCLGGMIIGRTPEYLGKRLHARDIKLVTLSSLALWAAILAFSAVAAILPAFWPGGGALGSGAANENAIYLDITLAIAMILGRFGVIVPTLASASSLTVKPRRSATAGTAITGGAQFVGLLAMSSLAFNGPRLTPSTHPDRLETPVRVTLAPAIAQRESRMWGKRRDLACVGSARGHQRQAERES